jgi:hypothetical protein
MSQTGVIWHPILVLFLRKATHVQAIAHLSRPAIWCSCRVHSSPVSGVPFVLAGATPDQTASSSTPAAIGSGPVADHLMWVLETIDMNATNLTPAIVTEQFDAAFLAELDAAQIVTMLRQMADGAALTVDQIIRLTDYLIQVQVHTQDGDPLVISFSIEHVSNRIAGLVIEPASHRQDGFPIAYASPMASPVEAFSVALVPARSTSDFLPEFTESSDILRARGQDVVT